MKGFKKIIFVFILTFCAFFICACNSYVVGIQKTESVGDYDVYTVSYSDGSSQTISVKDGEDGRNITVEDLYNSAVANGYTGTMLDFIRDYCAQNVKFNDEASYISSKALLSTVAIFSEFTVSSGYAWIPASKSISIGGGAGIILDINKTTGDAYIMTNFHVVYNTATDRSDKMASKIVCFLYGSLISRSTDGSKDANGYPIVTYSDYAIECEFVGGSMQYDIAVLKVTGSDIIKNSNAVKATFANSDEVVVGNTAVAIGNPEGYGFSATRGIISVDSEYLNMTLADETTTSSVRVIRIDAAINGGNSGGGLFDSNGNCIGIVNSKMVDTSIDNIAFAIPSNVAYRVANNILRNASAHNKKAYKALFGIDIEVKDSRAVYDVTSGQTKIVQDIYIQKIEDNSIASHYPALEAGCKIEKIYIQGTLVLDGVTRLHQIGDLTWLLDVGDVVGFKLEGRSDLINMVMTESAFSEIN